MHAIVYVDGALEAKCTRDSSHRRFFTGAWSGQRAKRTSNGATRATKSNENCSYEGHLGVKKMRFVIQNGWRWFLQMCSPPRAGSTFWKKPSNFGRKRCNEQGQQTWKGRGTRNAHPRKATNRKCLFFQWNLQVFNGNKCSQLGIFRVDWGAKRDVFWRLYLHATFKIMLATEGGKQIYKKRRKNTKNMCVEYCRHEENIR